MSNRAAGACQPLNKLLVQHMERLDDHLELCYAMQDETTPGSRDHDAAQKCLFETQVMVQNFQLIQRSFNIVQTGPTDNQPSVSEETKAEPPTAALPGKRQGVKVESPPTVDVDETKPVKDISDLFTIDTNPTPIESLQTSKAGKRAEKNLKRKLSQSKLHPIGLPEPLVESEPHPKRSKQTSAPGTIRVEEQAQPIADKGNVDDEDSFAAKVEQKHQETESKRQKKLEKKRKRESNVSLEEHASAATKPKKPAKKKPKKGTSSPTETTDGNTVGRKRTAADTDSQTAAKAVQSKKRKKT